ncbi:exonuclease V-like [Rhopilema esculentum]|uniref:exonuclease V-like n=1 Tax=Rhopilema esculentum TaxID=499914 RepID=UPI0031D6F5D1
MPELEVHEIFDIECRTNEDYWALRMLEMYQQLSWLIEGATVRELSIFGNVWEDELFVNGVIDEIKLDGNKRLEIHELKTRTVKKMPAKAQQTKDKLQAMIYRKLVHDLLFRKCGLQALKKHVPLNWNLVLNYNLQMYANELLGPCSTLNEVFKIFDGFLRFVKFPELGSAVIEYCYQRDHSNIGFNKYQYDEMWLRSTIYHQLDYILGRREPVGVDIEEAWKCGRCDYYDSCAWRKTEEKKLKERNTSNFTHNCTYPMSSCSSSV